MSTTVATYENNRYEVRDTGEMIVVRSKLTPHVAIAFPDWDAVVDIMCLLARGLSPQMRQEVLTRAFGVGSEKDKS